MEFAWYAAKDNLAKRPDEYRDHKQVRSNYARDRDRILYSKAFRRLSHKTQVYLSSENSPEPNEHVRMRLTHSLEVSQIAEAIARPLGLNNDLIEAICLGHDVGHAPFGHAGERQLDDILHKKTVLPRIIIEKLNSNFRNFRDQINFGDFRHNFQSVRQFCFLETYQNNLKGLNLTYQCLDGILRHTSLNSLDSHHNFCKYPWMEAPTSEKNIFEILKKQNEFTPTLEGRVVQIADEIAQVCHDLNDAIELEVFEISKFLEFIGNDLNRARDYVSRKKKETYKIEEQGDKNENNAKIFSILICYFILKTYENIRNGIQKLGDQKNIGAILASVSSEPSPNDVFIKLKSLKNEIVINNYNVNRMDNKGCHVIRELYKAYLCDLRQLPDGVLQRYIVVKKKEIDRLGKKAKKWFHEIRSFLRPDDNAHIYVLSDEEINQIICTLDRCISGNDIRNQKPKLITKLMPYLAFDGDYMRTIVDYIASMTDAFAEREMLALYGR